MRAIVAALARSYSRLHETGGRMRYEVVQDGGDWIVRSEGRELARFAEQDLALQDVAQRLREAGTEAPSSLSVRYSRRTA